MSTTHLISDDSRLPYTIVGKKREDRKLTIPPLLSLVVLNRGGRPYRNDYFRELERIGNFEIISVEGQERSFDVEALSARYPQVCFLLLHQRVSAGEAVNLGMKEAQGRLVLVLWNDMLPGPLSEGLLSRILSQERLCTVPHLQSPKLETVPSIAAPAFYRNRLKTLPMVPSADAVPSLFPFDYCGLYERERFLLLGGYDALISNPHWQKMDFGFRTHMWGEKLLCSTSFRVRYLGDHEAEDTTPDASYGRFYLKNLAVRFDGDAGVLPAGRFLPYAGKQGGSIFSRIREFRDASHWVRENRFRFCRDARSVTDLWETAE
ncbi:glycosyltransferase family 2 protein [Sediminispirochaeta smaragdinae]|uniref:Glycosyl transferase family 2 n=1 Tax=Sediminispirochaeta smaragdinae (strain DSM 11293 / JCM 15392 / SEBR 4228) TaxID=573413 RepID=E1R3R4_SEDSS|nr:hypothetical protein [Sediminispirochaeta smaragdinae]ADK82035.1 conserved hypothetical protein [Sediminispirochaeta smaragdinae DSM 11293]